MTYAIDTTSPWLPFGTASTSRARLFCLPHAGGSAAGFAQWQHVAGPDVSVCPVQPPGRAERYREQPHATVASYVDALVSDLGDEFTGDYALFGHSVGALVAFELVRALCERGAPLPVHLFVSGRAAPHLPDHRPGLCHLPAGELVPHLRDIGGTPEQILTSPELLELFLPLLRADFAVNETYRYVRTEPLPVPITAFGGSDDPRAGERELRSWAKLTDAGFAAHLYPGGHFYLENHAERMHDVMRAAFTGGHAAGTSRVELSGGER